MRDLSVLVDAGRLRTYTRIFVAAYALGFIGLFLSATDMVDASGKPLGYDFITFWSAARLTLDGNAAAAFDFRAILEAQRLAVPANRMLFLWHYPPTFQLVVTPLGLMPYVLAYFAFIAFGLAAFVAAMRPLVPWRHGALLLVALPGTYLCLLHGQNSLFSAALLATAIVTIDRRPVLAGIAIGLLAYKPQLGVLFPLVLAATGRWRVFAVAAATVVAYAGLATLVLGTGLWVVFIDNLAVVRQVMETGQLPWGKMPSAFVFLRKLGVAQPAAYAAQVLVTLGVAATVVLAWWRRGPTLMAGAALAAGTLLLTPYTFDYEMAILAVPLAILARHLVRHGASMAERALLLALAVSPFAMGTIVDRIGVQVGFLALAATFAWTARLALTGARQAAPATGTERLAGVAASGTR